MAKFMTESRFLKCRHPFLSAIGFCIVLGILILYKQRTVISIFDHDFEQPPDLNWLRGHIRTASKVSRSDASVSQSGDLTHRECMELLDQYQQHRRGGRSWSFCADDFEILRKCMRSPELGTAPLPNFFPRNATTTIVDPLYSEASVAFVHLPKSGGTSVEEFLFPIVGQQGFFFSTQIGISHCSEFTKAAHILSKSQNQLFLYSKRTYGLHEFTPKDKPFMYVTWLREPVDRIVSAYYYIKKTRPTFHTMYMKYVAKSRNLTGCLQRIGNDHFPEFDNCFVRLLQFGTFPDVDAAFEDCCGSAGELSAVPAVGEKHYLIARENLRNNMAFVGLLEEFKLSQDMLGYVLGKLALRTDVQVNTNPHKTQLTDFERREIERMNYWDIKLYQDAKEIFEQQKERYQEILKEFGI
ncbi:heparan-sulfate 6-O-sulfotransferase 3-B-like [Ptychodera flava]|uniref:heparan-sulfate 6-O-sulfotransferase 3-B-like n=1 Tax=Ptychodera flava TaxID=63121 RepID=UPI00396A8DF5